MSINIMNTMQYTNSQNYDRMRHLITETNLQGNLIKDYVWSNQMMPVAQIDAVIPAKPVPKKACPRERGGGGGSAGKNPVNYTYNYLSFSCTSVVIPAQAGIQSIETITYLYTDHLMTARLATNNNGIITWRWEGEAFGNTPTQELAGVSVNLRFPGQYYDSETNLHYNMMRYYDPALGRYITSDPIGLDGGMNTYLYTDANPIIFIDEHGVAPRGRFNNKGKQSTMENIGNMVNPPGDYKWGTPALPSDCMLGWSYTYEWNCERQESVPTECGTKLVTYWKKITSVSIKGKPVGNCYLVKQVPREWGVQCPKSRPESTGNSEGPVWSNM